MVPYDPNKKYKVSMWLKTLASSASQTTNYYPSIIPYDMDGNQINYYQITSLNDSVTTLSQDLNPGDTVVHATSLSGWTTVANNYYCYLAIHNYKSSTGVQLDGYTRNIIKFINYGEDKTTVINKTNNTLTLPSAYTGEIVPAGTTISQNADGGSLIYPFSAIKKNQTVDWTYKENVISSSFDKRLPVTKYIRFYATAWQSEIWFFYPCLLDVTESEEISKTTGGSWSTTAPTWVNGKYMWSRQKVTYVDGTSATRNATCIAGASAKIVNVNASSQMFKSTTGPTGTFTPQYIYLYPDCQNCTYSKWQYSTDGGVNWNNVSSGSHSLTIGTYNSKPNSLRIERTCDLYTDVITAITFKCVTTDASIYDTTTVVKMYDVSEVEIGGRNYFLLSDSFTSAGTGSTGVTPTITTDAQWQIVTASGNAGTHSWNHANIIKENFETGTSFVFSFDIKRTSGSSTTPPKICFKQSSISASDYYEMSGTVGSDWKRVYYIGSWDDSWEPSGATDITFRFNWSGLVGTYLIRKLKMETGNVPTD